MNEFTRPSYAEAQLTIRQVLMTLYIRDSFNCFTRKDKLYRNSINMKLNFNIVGFKRRLFRTLHKILAVSFRNLE